MIYLEQLEQLQASVEHAKKMVEALADERDTLTAENASLRAELLEQAKANGAGAEREAKLMAACNAISRECNKWAREAGEAKGRLEGSELPGIVDGWREKCERLEAENAALTEKVERLEKESARAWTERNIAHAKVEAWESVVYVEGLPLRAVRVNDWGPGEGDITSVPEITPKKLTDLLSELSRLRAALKREEG